MCPGLTVTFTQEQTGEKDQWCYADGLRDYLRTSLTDLETVPAAPVHRHVHRQYRRGGLGGAVVAGGR